MRRRKDPPPELQVTVEVEHVEKPDLKRAARVVRKLRELAEMIREREAREREHKHDDAA